MRAQGGAAAQVMAPIVAIALAAVSALSLIAFLALSAYAPDIRSGSDVGAHALSKSAIGFAGLGILLEASNISNSVSHGRMSHDNSSLTILTPSVENSSGEISQLALRQESLIILPKWQPMPDPSAYGQVLNIGVLPRELVEKLLRSFSPTSKIKRQMGQRIGRLFGTPGMFPADHYDISGMDATQTLGGKDWIPLLVDQHGNAVLSTLRSRPVYVLADPDLMNTHGLHDVSTASLALQIIKRLRVSHAPVLFDVTLNGFGQSPSLLRGLFEPPFLGATLCAIFAAVLIGFHATVRFGAPQRAEVDVERGKTALTRNTADLIRMLHREPGMASRYAQVTKRLVLHELGMRRQHDAGNGETLLKVLERDKGTSYSELLAEAEQVKNRAHLVILANSLFQWKERMVHAR